MKRVSSFFLLLFALAIVTPSMAAGDLTGTYTYEAQGTPYEYSEGEIIISKDGKSHEITLKVNYATIKASNVEVKKNTVKFRVYVEGMDVDVTLNFDGESLSGEASTYEGSFPLKGKKK